MTIPSQALLEELVQTHLPGNTVESLKTTSQRPSDKDFWIDLATGKYWHALNQLNYDEKQKANKLPNDAETRQKFAQILYEQLLDGANTTAAQFPLYYDVWEKLLAPESVVAPYIDEKKQKFALNNGLWHALSSLLNEDVKLSFKDELVGVISKLLVVPQFAALYDFQTGAKRAEELIRIEKVDASERNYQRYNIGPYARWIMTQELFVPQAQLQTRVMLRLPLLFTLTYADKKSTSLASKEMLNEIFADKKYYSAPQMQQAMMHCAKNIIRRASGVEFDALDEHAVNLLRIIRSRHANYDVESADVWRQQLSDNRPRKLDEVGEWISETVRQEKRSQIRELLVHAKQIRVDELELLDFYARLPRRSVAEEKEFSFIVRKTFETYAAAKARPSQDVIYKAARVMLDNAISNHVARGFIAADAIMRSSPAMGNALLETMERLGIPQKRDFTKGIARFADLKGRIRVADKYFHPDAFRPQYNFLRDYIAKEPKYFVVR